MRINLMRIVLLFLVLFLPASGFTNGSSDYLILQDIGLYKYMGKGGGQGPGLLAGTGHFDIDHIDNSYGALYFNETNEIGVKIEVTQHAGSDSDKWLLHEVERGFRSDDLESKFEGTIKEINGNKIITWLYGTSYRWVSNNVVVYISYSDPQLTKPEPIEIVQAYLQKFPSTITLTDAEAKSKAHNEQWIKDEMERRLWLGDKWFMALQTGKAEMKKVLREAVDHMKVFLDYREKYYGISAKREKQVLWEYLQANNGTGIKNKLQEYKDWWAANKDGQISI